MEKKAPSATDKSTIELTATTSFMHLSEKEKREYLSEKLQLDAFNYQIKSVNLNQDVVVLRVSY